MNLRLAPIVWVVVFLAVLVWSAIAPKDRANSVRLVSGLV